MVRRGIALLVTVLLIQGSTGPAFAGFASDWIANKTSTGGGSFEGQKRGYLYGGSMSARWRNSNDYLFTISKPKISAGCGGIDLFAGGFSFLGFDYLVAKFQNMIMNAPAVIFDIALKALSEQLSGSMKALDHIIETINGIQVDDCGAAKSIVGSLGIESAIKAGVSKIDDPFALESTLNESNTSQGTISSWTAGHEQATADDRPKEVDIKNSVAQCTDDTISTLLQNHVGGSLLESILVTRLGFNADIVSLFRGLIGDVKVGTAAEGYKTVITPACSQNNAIDNIEDIKAGTVYTQAVPGGECTPMADGVNLNAEAAGLIDAIVNNLKTGTAYSPTVQSQINMLSYPAYSVLKTAIMANSETIVKIRISEVAAAGLAFGFFSDLAGRMDDALKEAMASNKGTGAKDLQNSGAQCQKAFLDDIKKSLDTLQDRADKRVQLFYQAYVAKVQEANSLVSNLDLEQKNKELVESNTSKLLKGAR